MESLILKYSGASWDFFCLQTIKKKSALLIHAIVN